MSNDQSPGRRVVVEFKDLNMTLHLHQVNQGNKVFAERRDIRRRSGIF
jgi:hypothetical protein